MPERCLSHAYRKRLPGIRYCGAPGQRIGGGKRYAANAIFIQLGHYLNRYASGAGLRKNQGLNSRKRMIKFYIQEANDKILYLSRSRLQKLPCRESLYPYQTG